MRPIKQSESVAARRLMYFRVLDSADYVTPLTGVTLSAGDLKVSKAGGAEANHAGTWAEIAGGLYTYTPTTGEVDTLGEATFRLAKSGTFCQPRLATIVPWDNFDSTRLGLTALPNAAAGAAGGLPILSQIAQLSATLNRLGRRPFYVTPSGGNDSNTGLYDPENAKATIPSAMSAASDGDVIILLPDLTGSGARHVVSSSLNVKSGVSLVGMGAHLSRVQLTGSAVFNLPARTWLSGFELDGSSNSALTGLLYLNSTGSVNSRLHFSNLRVVARFQAASLSAISQMHQMLIESCELIGGFNALAVQGNANNTVRVVNSRLEASNLYAVVSQSGDVSALQVSQGQVCVENSEIHAVSYSTTAEQVNGILVQSAGIADVRVNGGSIKTLTSGSANPIQRIIKADGTSGVNTRVHLGAVSYDDDAALIELTGGAVVEKLSTTAASGPVSIATGGITSSSFAAGAITASSLADSLITAAKIATDAITADKLAADAIGASEISTAAVAKVVDAIFAAAKFQKPGASGAETATFLDLLFHLAAAGLGKQYRGSGSTYLTTNWAQTAIAFESLYNEDEDSRTPVPGTFVAVV